MAYADWDQRPCGLWTTDSVSLNPTGFFFRGQMPRRDNRRNTGYSGITVRKISVPNDIPTMVSMKFGIRLPTYVWKDAGASRESLLSFAERAEQLGFDSLWTVDHYLQALPSYRATFLDALTTLSAVAARTERIRLGTAILVLPLRNPVLLAKRVATLDVLSNGRFDFGVGVGWHEGEFDAVGVPIHERGKRTDEILHILKRLFTEENVSYEGEFYRFKDVTILPKPVQKPYPPIWVAGGQTVKRVYYDRSYKARPTKLSRALKRIARDGDGWLATSVSVPELLQKDWERISSYAKELGRDPSGIRKAQTTYMFVTQNVEDARKHYDRIVGKDFDEFVLKSSYFIGSTREIVEKIEERRKMGIDLMILTPVTLDVNQLDLWADEIKSRFE